MNKDLTVGNPTTILWKFCLPLFGSVIFQQLYNIADSLVAGKFIGEEALAAVGNSYEITLIFIAFAFGCNMGCSVITSQFFGAKDYKNLKSAISTSLITSLIVCLTLMGLGFVFGRTILKLIHTPDNLLDASILYLNIYILGLPFVIFYNISNGIFSAFGDSKTPFYFLAFSSLSNILVDIYFVRNLKMGIAGVAWATFICQGISCILALYFIFKRVKAIEYKEKINYFDIKLFRKFCTVAIPSTLQQSFISIGNILIQGIINGFGSGVIAGYAAGVKLNNLVITSLTTLGNGISNYTAQNLGAKKIERINEGFKAGIKMVWLLCIPFCLLYFFNGGRLLHFFIDSPTMDALNTGKIYLRILAPFYFVVAVKLVADGILRGSQNMKVFMISTFTDLILRVVLAFILSKTALQSVGIWCAWPIGWAIATFMSVHFYKNIFVYKTRELVE